MSDKSNKMRDPYGQYVTSTQALKKVTEQISVIQTYGGGEVEQQDALSKLSIVMVELTDIQEESKKQYNECLLKTKEYIEKSKSYALATPKGPNILLSAVSNISNSIYWMACALGNTFQQDPIGDEDDRSKA